MTTDDILRQAHPMNHPLAHKSGIEMFGAILATMRKGSVECVSCGWLGRRDVYGPLYIGDPEKPDEAELVSPLTALGDKPCPHCSGEILLPLAIPLASVAVRTAQTEQVSERSMTTGQAVR